MNMVFLQGRELRIAADKYMKFAGDAEGYRVGRNFVEFTSYSIEPSDKPGVMRFVPDTSVDLEKYVALVEYHPEIATMAEYSGPAILSTDTSHLFSLIVRPITKNSDIKELPWLARLYVLPATFLSE
jgi:hypothetical protein